MRVLVAEDGRTTRELLDIFLSEWGYEVELCADGDQAWEALQAEDAPRLVLLDWNMPGKSGLELCKLLREQPNAHLTYILMVTGKDDRDDIVEALQAGADDYVVKPFDEEELKARIQVGRRMVELNAALLQAERTRVLAETAGAAAHEINQPLAALLGHIELLRYDTSSEDPSRESLDDIYAAGMRISDIVKTMGAARKYVTKPYIRGVDIVDFAASVDQE